MFDIKPVTKVGRDKTGEFRTMEKESPSKFKSIEPVSHSFQQPNFNLVDTLKPVSPLKESVKHCQPLKKMR